MLGANLFQKDGATYLIVVDHFSRYPELTKLTTTTFPAVIQTTKSIFSQHSIPEMLSSDSWTQFDSLHNFTHRTNSPRYPQSNKFVERVVKTMKRLLPKSNDPYLALLNYHTSPFHWCGLSPSELLMRRKVRTTLPQLQQQLIPQLSCINELKKDNEFKRQQKRGYSKCHQAQPLPQLPDDAL